MNRKILCERILSKVALENRINANKNAERDFDEWSINLLPKLSMAVNMLDLGCGTGKQVKLFSEFFTEDSAIYACDKSKESLEALKEDYKGLPDLKIIQVDFKELPYYLKQIKGTFDLVYSFYALYYAENLGEIIESVYEHLRHGGILWTVSPYSGTNGEILDIVTKYYPLDCVVTYSIGQFYKDVIRMSRKAGFRKIKVDILKNKIVYSDEGSFIKYLQNTTFFREEFEKELASEVHKLFMDSDILKLTKNAISIKAEK